MTTISTNRSPHRQPNNRHAPIPSAELISAPLRMPSKRSLYRPAVLLLACLTMTACSSRAPLEQEQSNPVSPEKTETRATENKPADLYDYATRERVASWCSLMEVGKRYPEIIKVFKVNELINKTEYIYDAPQWGKTDYWATPFEILETNRGDCEDFSIAKYYTLRKLGVPERKLRFIYTRSVKFEQAHMVLAYYPTPNGSPLILDSLDKSIKRSNQRKDLLPIFSFNRNGMWISRREGDGKFVGSSSRLNHWKDLQHRMDNHEKLMSFTHAKFDDDETPQIGMWRCKQVNGSRYSKLK